VFVIVMENRSPDQVLAGAFVASLAARYRVAANYHAITHPSVPNYLALTSGQTWGLHEDTYRVLPESNLGAQLTAAGITWRAYMDGLTSRGCDASPLPYRRDHNPFAYYGGKCPANVVPLTALGDDLAKGAPRFSWITPDDCHNTHDCPVSVGDDWLRETVTLIMASDAWKADGVIFLTWDEDDGTVRNRVLTLAISPGAGHLVSLQPYNHYSLLATIEDLMGVGRLGNAAGAASMQDLLGP
jgi:phosphatidylinositol-3-phosphatase